MYSAEYEEFVIRGDLSRANRQRVSEMLEAAGLPLLALDSMALRSVLWLSDCEADTVAGVCHLLAAVRADAGRG